MTKETHETVNRKYKDSLFRRLFNDKESLLSLYNAVNDTNYEDAEDLRINTLEDVLFLRMKNDISFVFNFAMHLYEHQSTYSGNMALRFLFYFNDLIKNELGDQTLYTSRQVKFPGPIFVVLYNGLRERPERWIEKLSDSFEQETDAPKIELEVLVLNVNYGHNQKLMEQCKLLGEYSIYVARVRQYAEVMPIDKAVERAIEECIEEDVLREFLSKNRSEAMRMSILEFDEEREMKLIRKAEYEDGWEEGKARGKVAGETRALVSIIRKSLSKGKTLEEISDILDMNYDQVSHMVDYITTNSTLSDDEIALKIISDN